MFELDPVLCRAFLEGYQSVATIDASELTTTASLYGEEQDIDTWLLRVIYREGNQRARRFLKSGQFHPIAEKWRELLPINLIDNEPDRWLFPWSALGAQE